MGIKRLITKGMRVFFKPSSLTNSTIHKKAKICSGSQINNSVVDRYSYVGHDCFLLNANIGSFCSIADNCRIGGANHEIGFVSSSPVFNKGKNVLKKNFAKFNVEKTQTIVIHSDVWIGANVIIKSGITIGVGAVIGAGSVVTHNVGDYEIWAGNPARLIKKRFGDDICQMLLETQWWTWEDSKILKYSDLFDDPRSFIEKFKRSL